MDDNDDELVGRAGAGDADAFGRLVRRHLSRVVGFAGRTLGDRAAAEDVAQEVFLRLWAGAARWKPRGARVGAWLHRVALNLCLDRLARRRDAPLDDAPDPPDPRLSAEDALHRDAIAAHVQRVLAELPPQQRAAIAFCHFQGFSNREAADIMDVSVDALESLLARARRTLHARLREVAPQLLGEA